MLSPIETYRRLCETANLIILSTLVSYGVVTVVIYKRNVRHHRVRRLIAVEENKFMDDEEGFMVMRPFFSSILARIHTDQ